MKLLIVGDYPCDPNEINGGVEGVSIYLVRALKIIQDLNIQVITCKKNISKEKIIENEGITIHLLPSLKHFGNITLNLFDKYRVRKKIRDLKPDFIHFQNHPNYAYVRTDSYCPSLTTVHGIISREVLFDKGIVNRLRGIMKTWQEMTTLRSIQNILCLNPYSYDVVHRIAPLAKTYLIPNPVSEKYFKLPDNEVPCRILCVANIRRLKNILDLLKAVNILKIEIPAIKLHIAGNIVDSDYFNIISGYIKEYKLENNVKYLGNLSEKEILIEYSECCVFVLPSLQENSPLVIQQAMAAGKVVVTNRIGGIPYLVKDGITGSLVDHNDVKTMAEKIKLIISDKKLRTLIGKAAKLDAEERFYPELIARKTYELYCDILNKK